PMTGLKKLYRFFDRSPLAMIALAMLVLFVVVGAFAPWIAPNDPQAQDLSARLQPPLTEGYVLGTDALGRDVLSRLIHGTRISLVVGFAAVLLSAVIGVVIGLISGYAGGWVDSAFMRVVDAWLAFPFLLLAIAIVAVLGRGL